jgi:hypothetical protein
MTNAVSGVAHWPWHAKFQIGSVDPKSWILKTQRRHPVLSYLYTTLKTSSEK